MLTPPLPSLERTLTSPDPVALLNAWLAIEALQPQTFDHQEKLLGEEPPRRRRGERAKPPAQALFPFDLASREMPWQQPEGSRAQLDLAEDEVIRWFLPIGFIQMKPAVERLVSNVEPEGPEREQAKGVAVAALAAFDERGYPVLSKLVLSSFGWACGEVLAGRVEGLHEFADREPDLCREIAQELVELAPDGRQQPTSRHGFIRAMSKLLELLGLEPELLERPRVAIRTIGSAEKDPVDIVNSFFLRDLHRVRGELTALGVPLALTTYLGLHRPPAPLDVLADKAVLERLITPERLPPARWPAPKPAKLVTLQQAAVNTALRDLAHGGVLSINGPPGTGKTTLLRDIVAGVLVNRADALVQFDDPAAAFTAVDIVAEGGRRQVLHRLDASLRGHGMVVASNNNAAVRNVSAELPLATAIAEDVGVRYFAGTADAIHQAPGRCWGLIAAVLGNRKNRWEFVEDAWWDPDWGLERYLAAAVGRDTRRPDGTLPAIVEAEGPPRSKAEAAERWRRARLDYREKRSTVAHLLAAREEIRLALATSAEARQATETARSAQAEADSDAEQAAMTRAAAAAACARADAAVADARQLVDGTSVLQPPLLKRLLVGDADWRARQAQALDLLRRAIADRDGAVTELRAAGERLDAAQRRSADAAAMHRANQERLARLQELEAIGPTVCAGTQAGPAFWAGTHDEIHVASPWADPDLLTARDQLFVAAVQLHRAFLDAAARSLKTNLGLMMEHLKGRRLPSGADRHLGDLWDSFFLVIPLVSTTFASFDRLMDGIGAETLGWLIVDEAGQATPQSAVGAIWRSRRALVIGDPLQIEPVSTVPDGLVRAIFTAHGAHPDLWAPPRASVQTLADSASPLISCLGTPPDQRVIGMPLLVHRRCQDPMFSISNRIAYDGLMVHAARPSASAIAAALADWLPGSCWIDVASNARKWSPVEGDVTIELLNHLADRDIRRPDLYLITPFRDAADGLRGLVRRSGVLARLDIAGGEWTHWCETRIGTVHTFQGKEAEAVVLMLGAPGEASRGARSWAGGTPNILNVAVTRAKMVLYVLGRRDAWANAGVFATAARTLPVVAWADLKARLVSQTSVQRHQA